MMPGPMRLSLSLEDLKELWASRVKGQSSWSAVFLMAMLSTVSVIVYKTIRKIVTADELASRKVNKNAKWRMKTARGYHPSDDYFERSKSNSLKKHAYLMSPMAMEDSENCMDTFGDGSLDPKTIKLSKTRTVTGSSNNPRSNCGSSHGSNWQRVFKVRHPMTMRGGASERQSFSLNEDSFDSDADTGKYPGDSDNEDRKDALGPSEPSGWRKGQKPFALIRDSHTCYVNAGLQVLMAAPDFYESLQRLVSSLLKTNANKYPATSAFVDFVKGCIESSTNMNSSGHKPHVVIEYILQAQPVIFKRGEQADCPEFVTTLMNHISQELPEDLDPVRQLFGGIKTNYELSKVDGSDIKAPFEESFTSITMSVKKHHHTIENCFDSYTAKQAVTGTNGDRFDQMLFKRLPQLLLVQLQSYEQAPDLTIKKLKDKMKLGEQLHFRKDWLTADPKYESAENRPTYSLMAVVYHSGPFSTSGHYTAGVKRPDYQGNLRWYFCDDSKVVERSWDRIRNAYSDNVLCLALYKRNDTFPADICLSDNSNEPSSGGAYGFGADFHDYTASAYENQSYTSPYEGQIFSKAYGGPHTSPVNVGQQFSGVYENQPFSCVYENQRVFSIDTKTGDIIIPDDFDDIIANLDEQKNYHTEMPIIRKPAGLKSSNLSERLREIKRVNKTMAGNPNSLKIGKPKMTRDDIPEEELSVLEDLFPLSPGESWSEVPAGLPTRSARYNYINAGLQILSLDPRVWKQVKYGVDYWVARGRDNMPVSIAFLDFMKNRGTVMIDPFSRTQDATMADDVMQYLVEDPLHTKLTVAKFVSDMLVRFGVEVTAKLGPGKHLFNGSVMVMGGNAKKYFEQLPLTPAGDYCSMEDCVDQFFVKVDEDKTVFAQKARFYSLPSLLLVEMKCSEPVKIDPERKLVIKHEWLHESSPERKFALRSYTLYGAVYRERETYSACVKLHSGSEWYCCIDDQVKPLKTLRHLDDGLDKSIIHLLLYKRDAPEAKKKQ